jgi:hypothetical protein
VLFIDDALLLRARAGLVEGEIGRAVAHSEVFTTGSWYYRLARAVHSRQMAGALSRPFGSFSADRRARVLAALDHLPPEIGLISLRDLVPVMGVLDVGRQLNLLSAEALAAAQVIGAGIRTTTDSPMLREGAAVIGVEVRIVVL